MDKRAYSVEDIKTILRDFAEKYYSDNSGTAALRAKHYSHRFLDYAVPFEQGEGTNSLANVITTKEQAIEFMEKLQKLVDNDLTLSKKEAEDLVDAAVKYGYEMRRDQHPDLEQEEYANTGNALQWFHHYRQTVLNK